MTRSYFARIFLRNRSEAPARQLYEQIILQSRREPFYTILRVPDTTDGRFELLILHLALVMRRLRLEEEATAELRQTLFDTLIFDMDQALRESGVGDLKVGPRLRVMGEAYYGRSKAYDGGLNRLDDSELRAALTRNLYGTAATPPPAVVLDAMSGYLHRAMLHLNSQSGSDLMAGRLEFVAVPEAIPTMEP